MSENKADDEIKGTEREEIEEETHELQDSEEDELDDNVQD
jgi:hypothetical protein